jgi:hypothetical protein
MVGVDPAGKNPFEGYAPEVPDGVRLDYGSDTFLELEEKGTAPPSTAGSWLSLDRF